MFILKIPSEAKEENSKVSIQDFPFTIVIGPW